MELTQEEARLCSLSQVNTLLASPRSPSLRVSETMVGRGSQASFSLTAWTVTALESGPVTRAAVALVDSSSGGIT
jgi:hypothetical protein